RHRASDLERHFRGVDFVVAAVVERHLQIAHWIAGENAALQRFDHALLGRSNVFAGHRAAYDSVHELEALALFDGFHFDLYVTVLAFPTGLPDEAAFGFRRLADRFAISHLRLADVCANIELALHAVHDDFQVQLTHSGENRLPGFGVGRHFEGWVFLN